MLSCNVSSRWEISNDLWSLKSVPLLGQRTRRWPSSAPTLGRGFCEHDLEDKPASKTRGVPNGGQTCYTLFQWWATVCDAGPALKQYKPIVRWLLDGNVSSLFEGRFNNWKSEVLQFQVTRCVHMHAGPPACAVWSTSTGVGSVAINVHNMVQWS